MRRAGKDRRNDVAAGQPSEQDGQNRLQAEQGSEADEDANGDAPRDSLRRVANREQLQRVLM